MLFETRECTNLDIVKELFTKYLIYAQVDPKTVQYLAGHENSKVTMDIYAKVKYNKPTELAAVVNSAFSERCVQSIKQLTDNIP